MKEHNTELFTLVRATQYWLAMVWRLYDWSPRGGQSTITEHSTLLTESMQHLNKHPCQ